MISCIWKLNNLKLLCEEIHSKVLFISFHVKELFFGASNFTILNNTILNSHFTVYTKSINNLVHTATLSGSWMYGQLSPLWHFPNLLKNMQYFLATFFFVLSFLNLAAAVTILLCFTRLKNMIKIKVMHVSYFFFNFRRLPIFKTFIFFAHRNFPL